MIINVDKNCEGGLEFFKIHCLERASHSFFPQLIQQWKKLKAITTGLQLSFFWSWGSSLPFMLGPWRSGAGVNRALAFYLSGQE